MADQLTDKQVAHIAHLARLDLSEAELQQYAAQLSSILAYVDQLQQVDTAGVETVGQITGLINVLDNDEPRADTADRDAFLAGAPASQPPYLKVKAVLE